LGYAGAPSKACTFFISSLPSSFCSQLSHWNFDVNSFCTQIDLTLYDPKGSSSGEPVTCDQGFCAATYGGKLPGCTPNVPCEYSVMYGDGSSTTGFFVTDVLEYDQVCANGQTRPANGSITFG
jgi:hypothetical protein